MKAIQVIVFLYFTIYKTIKDKQMEEKTIYIAEDKTRFDDKQKCIDYESLLEDEKDIYLLLIKDENTYNKENLEECHTKYEELLTKHFPEALKVLKEFPMDCGKNSSYEFGNPLYENTGDLFDDEIIFKVRRSLYNIFYQIREASRSEKVDLNCNPVLTKCLS